MDITPEQQGTPDQHDPAPAEPSALAAVPEPLAERIAQFSGLVGEVADPLAWGMDLTEESLAGPDEPGDSSTERFLRAYLTFSGEPFGIETLRVAAPEDERDDVVRAALSSAIAAPLHTDIRSDPSADGAAEDFADAYQDYRSAMRAVFDDVAGSVVETSPRRDGEVGPAARVSARGITAQYVEVADRALIVTGPTDLVERVQVVVRPIRNLLHDEDGPQF